MQDRQIAVARYWNERLAPYARADDRAAWLQLLPTALLFVAIWLAMVWSLDVSYWLTVALAVPASGLLVRLFIFQHDCGHGSFFGSRRWNDRVGGILGIVTLTPYRYWQKTHAVHHATSGDLDRRSLGDVQTLTVDEYLALPWTKRLGYRIYRNPFVLLGVGPFYQFVIKHRMPLGIPKDWRRERLSVWRTNVALLAVLALAWATIGLDRLLLVHGPIFVISGAIGVWLFYVQHQFEDTYWRENPDWDFHDAGIQGSSFYDLPPILHWFTGNIGFHHIHHLASRIPNYRLASCFAEVPELHRVTRLTLISSLKSLRLHLWDEGEQRLIGFGELQAHRA